jgi:hypothetical protein
MPIKDIQKRREYERERKQRKRLELIQSLPAEQREKAIKRNESRRSKNMRWERVSSLPTSEQVSA